MPFDAKAFQKERFEPRVIEVPVPDLALWFPEGEKPVWKVRGLTGTELGFVNEAEQRFKDLAGLVKKLMSGSSAEKIEATCQNLGATSEKEPAEVIRGLEMLRIGSVDPPCDLPLAIKLNRYFAGDFRLLVKHIQQATLQGHVPGKSKASGRIKESEQPSHSAATEADSSSKSDRTSSRKAT